MKFLLFTLAVLVISRTDRVNGVPLEANQIHFQNYQSMNNDIDDFLALIPVHDIKELFYKYLSEDEDFGEVIDYILSNEFKSLINEIGSQPEVKELIDYIQSAGLDFNYLIEKLKEMFVLGKFATRLNIKSYGISGGLPGFFRDLVAILPVDDLEKLYHKKLETSQDFVKFIKSLKSQKFIALIDQTVANPKVGDLLHKAETKGIDVDAVIDYIKSLLEKKLSINSLPKALKNPKDSLYAVRGDEQEVIDILHHIWAQVPMDNLTDVIFTYLLHDDDFGALAQYMLGDEFKTILKDVESLDAMKALFKYLDEVGVEIYHYLKELHDLIGLDDAPIPPIIKAANITGGLPGFIQDVRSLLPIDYLYDYYDEMQEKNPKFKEFVVRLGTKEGQEAVDALAKHKGFNLWLDKLEAKGVDLDQVTEIVGAITGIHFPDRPHHCK
ncbi:hypothetical protein QAD02_023720 [Eretmocerus hayati]|uniref:Uncharacterized protein n=1 Tax=Eretmocerus hayati TaxID=131215 RepID=A0ACC2PWF7_9HYME|nr:hypothetical protein QAD02_023720 [Eretmocerus hayati]